MKFPRQERDVSGLHIRNFIDCVKSRQTPHCDVEVGHRSNTFALLANIALETRLRLDWDAKAERITNKEANQHLHYEYRRPGNWSDADEVVAAVNGSYCVTP